ncbi:MAG: hypothetical protein QOI06_1416 [Nocardioidaceae bacterium]|jgi:hypothetical protein|nr:hypothetical protein [Nocardioidaceae bacterium]
MLLARQGRVPLQHLRSGRLTERDQRRVAGAARELASAPLTIDVGTLDSDVTKPAVVLGSTIARLVIVDDVDVWAGERLTNVMRMLRTYANERAATVVVTVPAAPVSTTGRRFRGLCDRVNAVTVDLYRPDMHQREATRPGCVDITFYPDSPRQTTEFVALQGHIARIVDIDALNPLATP